MNLALWVEHAIMIVLTDFLGVGSFVGLRRTVIDAVLVKEKGRPRKKVKDGLYKKLMKRKICSAAVA